MDAKYLTYNAFDLAAEPAFQAWAQDAHDTAAWEQWLLAHPEQADKVAEAKQLLQNIQLKAIDTSGINRQQLWDKIDAATSEQASQPKVTRRLALRWIAAAAAACIALFIAIPIFTNSTTHINTAYATTEKAQLPDASTVQINADSKISFSEKNWDKERLVNLEGEAFFEVEKGKTFTVKTPKGNVQVLGTSFNVFSRGEKFEVVCKTGKVAVRVAEQEQILTPGESAILSENGQLIKNRNDKVQEIDWIAGIYRFENASLAEVMETIERQFDYSIDLPNELRQTAFTGLFQTNALDSALYQITWPLNLKYKVEDKRIVIFK